MWTQNYTPLAGSLALSALAAALPAFAMLYLLGVRRIPPGRHPSPGWAPRCWWRSPVYRMPVGLVASSLGFGATSACSIGWIIFSAILLYRVAVESGKFEIIKDSLGGLTQDRRLQALLIASVSAPPGECCRVWDARGGGGHHAHRTWVFPFYAPAFCSASHNQFR